MDYAERETGCHCTSTGSCRPTATGATSSAAGTAWPPARPARSGPPRSAYLGQIARSAEQLGFEAALTPTGAWCEDAWLATAMLTEVTERLKFLVAFRPGLISPTLAAQMAATFQRYSEGRLLLNVVTGGESAEQRAYGDFLDKAQRYRAVRRVPRHRDPALARRDRQPDGEHLHVEGARLARLPDPVPPLYFGGSSAEAGPVAARYSDVYLTWGEPPAAVDAKLRWIDGLARQAGRTLRYGIRLHVISRDTADEAWLQARPADRGRRRGDDPQGPGGAGAQRVRGAAPDARAARRLAATTWRSRRTCGPASAWSAAARARRWSAATPRSPTGSRSTPRSASPSSSCPGTRTWRRRTGSARACCRSCASAAGGSTPRPAARTTPSTRPRSRPRQVPPTRRRIVMAPRTVGGARPPIELIQDRR